MSGNRIGTHGCAVETTLFQMNVQFGGFMAVAVSESVLRHSAILGPLGQHLEKS
jgi:hypothetical protein